jgi:hypothetical protein
MQNGLSKEIHLQQKNIEQAFFREYAPILGIIHNLVPFYLVMKNLIERIEGISNSHSS